MNTLLDLGIFEIQKGLRERKFSVTELTKTYLARAKAIKKLNAYITITEVHALQQAKESDERIRENTARPLEGIPISIKDMFCTKNIQTTAGSKILSDFIPPYESTVTQKLWDQGCVLLGKLNLDEFAMGSSSTTSIFGPVLNPWDIERVTGGSSGGTAVSVAAGGALVSLGTDTGGSVRQPAAFCGIVGIKPTYGRCSRYGIIAFASSFDQAGVCTRSVRDSAIVLEAMAGHDPKDATSSLNEVPCYGRKIGASLKGKKVGIPKEWCIEGIDPDLLEAWENGKKWLKDAGCEIVEISIPSSVYSLPCYYILTPAEASSNLARYDGVRYGKRAPDAKTLKELYVNSRGEGFCWEVKRRILIGTFVLSHGYYDAYYKKACKIRKQITHEFSEIFQNVDVLLGPTTPNVAFSMKEFPDDPVTMYLNDILTVPPNIAGLTAMSIPAGINKTGLPLGLQLMAPGFQEERLFQFGTVLESCATMPDLPIHALF